MQNCLNDHCNTNYKWCKYCKIGFGKIKTCPQSMLTPKDEGIDNWFNFFKICIFWIFPIVLYTLDASIAFGKQYVLT
jgi:hypothetical protein